MKKGLVVAALVVTALLLGLATYAVADNAVYPGAPNGFGDWEAQGTVTATATVNPKITLSITTPDPSQTVDFGAVDPGAVVPPEAVNLAVESNKGFDLTIAKAGTIVTTPELNFATDLAAQAGLKGITNYTDNYSIAPAWDTDPGIYSGTVQYTVTQN